MATVALPESRINEPFIKARLALWLVERGVTAIRVSIDGAEVRPEQFKQILEVAGYSHIAASKSRVNWTGTYTRGGTQITVVSRPGLDLHASFPNGFQFIAECKGEPTPSGIQSGADLDGLYKAFGQLTRYAGEVAHPPDEKALVMADTIRMRVLAQSFKQNPAVKAWGVSILLVNVSGEISAY